MGSLGILRVLQIALLCVSAHALTTLSAAGAGDDGDCALYLNGPGRTSAYDYSLNLLKGNFNYEGQHSCITYDAINQAYLEARNRIVVSQPKGDWKAEDFASVGELILDISINLARRYGLTYEEIEKGLPLIDTSRTLIRDVCPPVFSRVECRAGKYRRLDGLCNNLLHPTWGSTMAPFQRLIGPLFADGINAPRIAHTGRDLPLSRVVSRTMHPDHGYHDHAGTVMVIAWGQFMDHDYTLTGTPLDPLNRNDPEECCKRPQHLKHPYCNEIRIPDDDYFYRLWGVKCIDFVRAFPSPRPGCRLGSRVPFNTLTGVIDGNTVYGVTDKFARKLRTGFGGLLRMNPVFKEYGLKDLLPLKLDIPDEGCTRPNKNMYCFEAGEIRVNEQLVLTVMHTLMAREHNRIARALAEVNPHWDDETLFQESRRINVAEIQHITYNEFLPILLGKDVMEKFGLVLEHEGYWDGYDQQVNPDVIDAFASAAFRFGHSLLPTAVERWSKAHKFIASKRLSDLIRRPYDLYRAGVLDEYVMGLMNQVAQAMDDSITQEVTNHLFKKVGARFGMDLVSFNMQRGREFGIPGYMEFRKFCGLAGADSFQDLFGSMPNETVVKYETIFEHPIDVDLWSGGVSERPLPGSMLGPTFACVIATQFSYSRRGDRFWYELPNQPSSFTPEQLAEVRKARLARVICDNTDIIDTVQLYPMVLPDHELNPRVPCRSGILPGIDFSKWAEPAPYRVKPLVTEAYVKVNETNVERNTTAADEINSISHFVNNTETPKMDSKSSAADVIVKGEKNVRNETDTVLKYVYKNEGKMNISQKPNSHPLNSLRRRKRTPIQSKAPLIVNYETNHGGSQNHGNPSPERLTGKIVTAAELADFNIETLHDHDHQAHRQNTNHNNSPKDKSSNEREGRIIVDEDDQPSDNSSTSRGESGQRSNEDVKESQEKQQKNYSGEQSQESNNDDSRENSESKESYRTDGNGGRRKDDYKSNESLQIDSREKAYTEGNSGEKSEYKDGIGTDVYRSKKFPTSHETNLFNVDARYHNRGKQDSGTDKVDSNESHERSGEANNSNSAEKSRYTDTKLRRGSSESGSQENENSRENDLKVVNKPSDTESSEEEEAVIAIMKKKKKKQHDKPDGSFLAADEVYNKKSSPIIKDVDLGDFTYERIHIDDKGEVAPIKDNHEKQANDPLIKPLTRDQPQTIKKHEKHTGNLVSSTSIPYTSESSEEQESRELVKIDDAEVKPVVEISSDKEESTENNSKEALKAAPNDTDLSLETLLGVKPSESDENTEKNIEKDSGQNVDVKQEFERIPKNYNHAQKEQQNNKNSDEHGETLQDDRDKYNPEPPNILTPTVPAKYDEHLNFKFDVVPIKLPEIKLPEDILAYPHEDEKADEEKDDSFHVKKDQKRKKNPKKAPFFYYDEHEYNADEPHSHRLENHEDHEPDYYNKNYGNDNKEEKYKKKEKYRKKETQQVEEDSSEDEDDDKPRGYFDYSHDDDEDLYEKFVRERFGKKDTFEQRSAKLLAPTRPVEDNARLFQALQNVLGRAQNIEKEAQKSGDPNAGYAWTVEYGRDL